MSGDLTVAHHHVGRLRVRSRAFESNKALLEMTASWLREQHGVRFVGSDAKTGSILVTYDPSSTDAGEILTAIASRTRLGIAEAGPSEPPTQRIFDAARAIDDHVLDWSGGRFGLGLVVPVALGVGSIGSLVFSKHALVPRWDTLLYWGVQFFRSLNEDQHRTARRPHSNGG